MAARPARKTGSGINRPMTRWRPCEFDRSFSQLRMGLFKVAAEAAALMEALLDKHLQPLEDQLRKVQGPLEDMICEFLKQQQLTGELEARVQAAEESLFQAHKALEACQEEKDQKIICLICRESRDHRSHTVSPIEEAVQEYKEKLKMHLEPLRKNLEDLLKFKSTEEKKAEELKSETQIKRQKVESEFEELHQFLNKEKQILLSRLEEEEKKILQRIMENETQLEEQSSSLMQLITEIEEKSQQPAIELLKIGGWNLADIQVTESDIQ
ncbi:E3 ubiquitin-protein ligase TRIM39-like [Microcaecilia unicolor]|uniref:E3 ubiquitin-protein ligase TRIM39-like n=1 Tax=Microcaecilia unicolor TaxID=1415580 RepID=A0A6P7X4V8_9AMPH|nr:E3 ubiquitin-protein ligase TRIM39-like [Microcaecilia unicolor]